MMETEIERLAWYLPLKPVVLPSGLEVEATAAFREFFGANCPAYCRKIDAFLLQDIVAGEYQGILHWTYDQNRRAFLLRDWPTLGLINAFGFDAGDHPKPERVSQLNFAAKIEGNRALLGLAHDPDPRMIDNAGNIIGNPVRKRNEVVRG
jgi:hypothetical protein